MLHHVSKCLRENPLCAKINLWSTHHVRYSPTLLWIGIVEGNTGEGFCDPGDLPPVDPVTLHLVPSKSVHKQGSYDGKK